MYRHLISLQILEYVNNVYSLLFQVVYNVTYLLKLSRVVCPLAYSGEHGQSLFLVLAIYFLNWLFIFNLGYLFLILVLYF